MVKLFLLAGLLDCKIFENVKYSMNNVDSFVESFSQWLSNVL